MIDFFRESNIYLLLPLFSACFYPLGAILLKQSMGMGVGIWRTTFLTNIMLGIIFISTALAVGMTLQLSSILAGLICGLLFFIGQVLTFLAFEKGDVSVATPVMGSKILFVALFSSLLFADPLSLPMWIAAAISTVAVALLNLSDTRKTGKAGFTVLLALSSAAAFAFVDTCFSKLSPMYGFANLMGYTMLFNVLFSFLLIPLFRNPLSSIPMQAWRRLGAGTFLIALQAFGLAISLGLFGNATAVNVVYGVRGLTSIAIVWFLGKWLGNDERESAGGSLFRYRIGGALLLLIAIFLLLAE